MLGIVKLFFCLGTKCLDIKDLKLLQGDTDFEPKDFYTPFFDDGRLFIQ